LTQLPGKNSQIGRQGHIGGHDIGTRLFNGEHDRREILGIIRIALDQRRLNIHAFQVFNQILHAAGAEGVGRVDDRPLLLAKCFHTVVGDYPGRMDVVWPKSE
jgi:hypothetical protein